MNSMSGEKLKGIPYIGTLPAVLTGTKAGYLHRYKVYGNTEQTGTPTPENPIVPSECGERTENVMPSALAETKTNNGITVTCDGNGVYTLSGTALSETYIVFRLKYFTIPISVGQGGQGTMSLFNTVTNGQIIIAFLNGNASIDAWHLNSANRKSNSYIAMGGAVCNAIQFYVSAGDNCDCVIKPCFTNDSIYPTSYIPYGYKLPLTSGSTPVDIYLGESQTTRRIKKLVLTGEEVWYSSSRLIGSMYAYNSQFPGIKGAQAVYCSHLPYTSVSSYQYGTITTTDSDVDLWMFTETRSPAAFKAYLQQQYANGTPVTIWYILATEETDTLNEPLRKIGDYADTIDSTQTTAQIPTSANSTTISWGGQGLAPSQFDSIQEWVNTPTYTYTNGEWVADNSN